MGVLAVCAVLSYAIIEKPGPTVPQYAITTAARMTSSQISAFQSITQSSQAGTDTVDTIETSSTMLLAPGGTSTPLSFNLTPGNFFVTLSSNITLDLLLANSNLWAQYESGAAITICPSNVCDLTTAAADPSLASGTLLFQIPSNGTYYLVFMNDYYQNPTAASFSAIVGMTSQSIAGNTTTGSNDSATA